MATSSAKTVDEYLAALPADRRAAIAAVRDTINRRIPRGYEHGMLYGGPAWYVPRSRLAETYNGQPLTLAVLGSQKNYMVLHLLTVYGNAKLSAWFGAKIGMVLINVARKASPLLPMRDQLAKRAVALYHVRRQPIHTNITLVANHQPLG